MKFAFQLALKNMRRKAGRTIAMIIVVAFLSLTLFGGAVILVSLQNGLESYEARLGADIVVVPTSATSHGTLDDILLQGITGNYYMTGAKYSKIKENENIEKISAQFFLASAKASCCSVRVQIIGFDPETDFSIQPWIRESYSSTIGDGDLVVGANINIPDDRKITFYGEQYTVVAQLAKTGTGLDSAVYTNMATIKKMASDASTLTESETFKDVNINTAVSAVFIKVKKGVDIQTVADQINIKVDKVKATPAKTMVSDISSGLGGVSTIIGILIGVIWTLAILILMIMFIMIAGERKKEFAVLRVLGANHGMLNSVLSVEATLMSVIGAAVGLLLSAILVFSLTNPLKELLGLPYLLPNVGIIIAFAIAALLLSVVVGIVTSFISAYRITKSETGLLLREDA